MAAPRETIEPRQLPSLKQPSENTRLNTGWTACPLNGEWRRRYRASSLSSRATVLPLSQRRAFRPTHSIIRLSLNRTPNPARPSRSPHVVCHQPSLGTYLHSTIHNRFDSTHHTNPHEPCR